MRQKAHTVIGRILIEVTYLSIPQLDDSSQEEEDSLFDDKLLPADKNKIMHLKTEIKRIRGGAVYPTGY